MVVNIGDDVCKQSNSNFFFCWININGIPFIGSGTLTRVLIINKKKSDYWAKKE